MSGASTSAFGGVLAEQDAEAITQPRLRECPDCGHFQLIPAMPPGSVARCLRCDAVLRRTRHDSLGRGLALNVTALALLVIACSQSLITVSTFGMYRTATIFSGPEGFRQSHVLALAIVVGFLTIVAPLLRLLFLIYVLTGLRMSRPPVHVRHVFAWAERIRPWSMIEVFLLGVFVAYTELPKEVHSNVDTGLYCLIALMIVIIAADAFLDRQAVWDEMERRGIPDEQVDHPAVASAGPGAGVVACDTCGLVCLREWRARSHCPRCGGRLEGRKKDSIRRTWALLIAAAVLYVPANVYPVLGFKELGSGSAHTIIGGAEELLKSGLWPLALLVFLASIAVPCLKITSLVTLLITTQRGSAWQLRQRTVLYRIVNTIGRWSMIDVFMESVLIGLVQFGALVTIGPGIGAVAFAGVVILTMFAAESFDPRLIWDAAGRN